MHLLLHYTGEDSSLNTLIGNSKRFMAYQIIKELKENREMELLKILQQSVQNKDCEKEQLQAQLTTKEK